MAKRESAQLKWKKKRWIEIVAPEMFQNAVLGETFVDDSTKVVGRVVQVNMMNVVRNPKMQSITMRFKVTDVSGTQGVTEPLSYVMAPAAVKRLVRSRRDRIDDSFVVVTKDGKPVRMKPILVTQNNYTAAQRSALRKLVRENIAREAAQQTFADMISRIVKFDLQKDLKRICERIVRVRTFDIRSFEIDDRAKAIVEAPVDEAAETKDESAAKAEA